MFESAFAKAVENRKTLNSNQKQSNRTDKEFSLKVAKKKGTWYNEYQTNAMRWARSTERKVGDVTILNANGKYFALIEATEDGFIELKKGSYKEVQTYYERAYRKTTDEVYGNTESFRLDQGRDIWDMQPNGEGRDGSGNNQQVGSERLQGDTTGNNEHLRSSDKGKSFSLKQDKNDLDNKIKKISDLFGISDIDDYVDVQKNVLKTLQNENFFTDKNRSSKIVINKESGMSIEINRKSINETFSKGKKYEYLGKERKYFKLATIRQIDSLIQNAKVISRDNANYHTSNSSVKYTYLKAETNIDGIPVEVTIDIRQSPQNNKLWVHQVYTRKNTEVNLAGADSSKTSLMNLSTNNIIHSKSLNVKKEFSYIDKIGETEHLEKENKKQKADKGVSYSLKWHPDLPRQKVKMVEGWLQEEGSPESTRITDTANWYMGRISGQDLFVIYSNEDAKGPTILYEVKGKQAKVERNVLRNLLEEFENGRSIVEVSKDINTLLSGDWVQEKYSLANNNAGLGARGSNTGYASVLQGKSPKFIGSPAFRNVIKNLFDIQERGGNKEHSLKGTVVDGEIASLVKKYGTIPKGENPARDIDVPRKTAGGRKVSQTVRTILEAKATPDEALPSISELVTKGEFSYDAYTDKEAIAEAEEAITKKGWEQAKADWYKAVGKGEVSKRNTALGWAIYNNAVNSGETETALEVLGLMVKHQRSAAQALQATRILKKPYIRKYKFIKASRFSACFFHIRHFSHINCITGGGVYAGIRRNYNTGFYIKRENSYSKCACYHNC